MKYHQFEEKAGISYSAELLNIRITSNSLESHLVFMINTTNRECMLASQQIHQWKDIPIIT